MKILFVDDNVERLKALKRELTFFPTIIHAFTSFAAKEELVKAAKEPFDVICLDHDLGDNQPDFTEDGTVLAEWMADNRDLFESSVIIIHSFNSPAARRMAEILDDGVCNAPVVMAFNPKIMAVILNELKTMV